MISIQNIYHEEEAGQFYAQDGNINWKSNDGLHTACYTSDNVVQAEWFEGAFKILCKTQTDTEVLTLEGFCTSHFDTLFLYFQDVCNIDIIKHKHTLHFESEEEQFDRQLQRLEVAAKKVNACKSGSVLKKAREPELLIEVGNLRDWLEQMIQGERAILSRVFSASRCQRFGRLHVLIDTVELEVYKGDPRWAHLQNQLGTVEAVLRELNTFCWWGRPDDTEHMPLPRVKHPRVSEGINEGEVKDGDSECEGALFPCCIDVDGLGQDYLVLSSDASLMPGCNPQDDNAAHYDKALMPGCNQQDDNVVHCDTVLMPGCNQQDGSIVPDDETVMSECDRQDDNARDDQHDDNARENQEMLTNTNVDNKCDDPTILPMCEKMNTSKLGGGQESDTTEKWLYPDSVFEGWVWKQSKHLKIWKRRWLVLRFDQLNSFKRRNKRSPTITFKPGDVFDVYIADYELALQKTFCIQGYGRKFYVACDTKEHREKWMREVLQVLGSARNIK